MRGHSKKEGEERQEPRTFESHCRPEVDGGGSVNDFYLLSEREASTSNEPPMRVGQGICGSHGIIGGKRSGETP